jgi:hypothetical protein
MRPTSLALSLVNPVSSEVRIGHRRDHASSTGASRASGTLRRMSAAFAQAAFAAQFVSFRED